jgi:hypothetical protein
MNAVPVTLSNHSLLCQTGDDLTKAQSLNLTININAFKINTEVYLFQPAYLVKIN